MRDWSHKHGYITTHDGRYVSASCEENEYVLTANHDIYDKTKDSKDEVTDSIACTVTYKSILVQCVLSPQVHQEDKLHRHNLFLMFFIVKDYRAHARTDCGNSNNLISSNLVKELGLTTYDFWWPVKVPSDHNRATQLV